MSMSMSMSRPFGVSTEVRRSPERVRRSIMRLIREQRHFLKLFRQTNSAERKALLRMINHIKALSQIAHNIFKFRTTLTPSEKVVLRRPRRHLNTLSDIKLRNQRKVEALRYKQKLIHMRLKIALTHLNSELE